jgi:hypothetical protein
MYSYHTNTEQPSILDEKFISTLLLALLIARYWLWETSCCYWANFYLPVRELGETTYLS